MHISMWVLPPAETEVSLLEVQIRAVTAGGKYLELYNYLWETLKTSLARTSSSSSDGSAVGGLSDDALAAAFVPVVLAPGRLSRPALASALESLGCGVSLEAVLQAELSELSDLLPDWVSGVSGTDVMGRWHVFLQAYASAFQQHHAAVALLPEGCPELTGRVMVRAGGVVSLIRSAAPVEYAANVRTVCAGCVAGWGAGQAGRRAGWLPAGGVGWWGLVPAPGNCSRAAEASPRADCGQCRQAAAAQHGKPCCPLHFG